MSSTFTRFFLPVLASLMCLPFAELAAQQQQSSGEYVEVRNVRFSNQRSPAGDSWYRMEIELRGNENPYGDQAPNSRWIDNIEVAATIAFPVEAHGSPYTFYRTSATIVSLQQRQTTTVYFYLPWEIVDRDRLGSRAPEFYALQISVDGNELGPQRNHFSDNIGDASALSNFLNAASEGVARTDGIFRPTYLTPFNNTETRRNPPTYRRIELE